MMKKRIKKRRSESLNNEKSCSFLSGLLLFFLSFWLLLFFWSGSFFFELFQSIHGDLGSGGDTGGKFVGSSSESDLASLTLPDST